MIAVIADPREHVVVREFFELFKTPWEFYSEDRTYDVVLCVGDIPFAGTSSKLILHYAGKETQSDVRGATKTRRQHMGPCVFKYEQHRIPIYGESITFSETAQCFLTDEASNECAAFVKENGATTVVRIGYDLFHEVRLLLTVGQPPANAAMPTLDLHIALLRDAIIICGVPLVEIPPVPAGYRCTACLTHDVDHPSIRRHRWDHTAFGFLYRAVVGSCINLIRQRSSLRDLLANWVAALKLPFVYLGLVKDFWCEFDDQYLKLEDGLPSTFFVIPFKDRPGSKMDGPTSPIRAAAYEARDIASAIRKLKSAGCEVGLHGIDAWIDSSSGREELEEIRRLTGDSATGVRMHWLYSDEESPRRLEAAGAAYDSTVGYNETVGYRAGTTQIYKPLTTNHMLELPLHAMDTALFYPSYLALSERRAIELIRQLVDNTCEFGGALTINWHDRSLAPERLWGKCYREAIRELKNRGAWFATAGHAVSWFQKRRSASFEPTATEMGGFRAKLAGNYRDNLPGLRLRLHNSPTSNFAATRRMTDYVDTILNESPDMTLTSEAAR